MSEHVINMKKLLKYLIVTGFYLQGRKHAQLREVHSDLLLLKDKQCQH